MLCATGKDFVPENIYEYILYQKPINIIIYMNSKSFNILNQ